MKKHSMHDIAWTVVILAVFGLAVFANLAEAGGLVFG